MRLRRLEFGVELRLLGCVEGGEMGGQDGGRGEGVWAMRGVRLVFAQRDSDINGDSREESTMNTLETKES